MTSVDGVQAFRRLKGAWQSGERCFDNEDTDRLMVIESIEGRNVARYAGKSIVGA
jgi:hypothetical protein